MKQSIHTFLLFLFVTCLHFNLAAQVVINNKTPDVYIVRHAEKETGIDPVLTEAGKRRAGDLVRVLRNKQVQKIYVSQFRRSGMTADSLRLQLHIDTVHYMPDTSGEDLFRTISSHHDEGKTILIIGHSNTIPAIIHKLGITGYPRSNIPDNEYDDLFVIKNVRGKPALSIIKYGRHSAASSHIKH